MIDFVCYITFRLTMAALGKACTLVPVRHLNANRAAVAGLGRNVYLRTYPTVLVMPDGSTVNIRYKEPRRIIKVGGCEVFV